MKKRDPKKQAKVDKQARKRAQYEKARKLKQKSLRSVKRQVENTASDASTD